MPGKLEKLQFMLRKLKKDLRRPQSVYPVASRMHSQQLGEYYFVMDEQQLRSGYSQNFHFDDEGIPIIPTYIDVEERKLIYYPISIGQFGISIYHTWLNTQDDADRARFLKIVDWFYENRIEDQTLGTHWLTAVPKPEYRVEDPWPSAFTQSRALSILLRGWQLSGDNKYRDTAISALKIYDVAAAEGGVTTFTKQGPLYEEYPAPFITGVLDGSIFSLFGLHECLRACPGHSQAEMLFKSGVDALKKILPTYDMGFWIRYNLCDQSFYPQYDPASITYFRLVNAQLRVLSQMTGDKFFEDLATKWKAYDRPINIARMYWLKYRALRKLNRI